MTAKKSMADVAYDYLSTKKKAVAFKDLWKEVSKKTGVGEDRVASFYSDLSIDGRFAQLDGNKWDIKNHLRFEDTQIDLSAIEVGDDDEGVVYDDDGNIIEEPDNDDTY